MEYSSGNSFANGLLLQTDFFPAASMSCSRKSRNGPPSCATEIWHSALVGWSPLTGGYTP